MGAVNSSVSTAAAGARTQHEATLVADPRASPTRVDTATQSDIHVGMASAADAPSDGGGEGSEGIKFQQPFRATVSV